MQKLKTLKLDIPDEEGLQNLETSQYIETPTSHLKSIEYLIDNKIKLGRYQYIVSSIMSLLYFSFGAMTMALVIANVFIQQQLGLSEVSVIILTTQVFLGNMIGQILSGFICDQYGRRSSFLVGSVIFFVSVLLSVADDNLYYLIFAQLFVGIVWGVLNPVGIAYVAELTPNSARGSAIVIVTNMFALGEVYACIIAFLTVTDGQPNGWRFMIVYCTIPIGIMLVLGLIYVRESPRFALFKNIEEGIEIINEMYQSNHGDGLELSKTDVDQLSVWVFRQRNRKDLQSSSVKYLLSGENTILTILLWVIWFAIYFSYMGTIYILPWVLSAMDHTNNALDLWTLLIAAMGELPSTVVALLTIETETFGRKYSIAYSALLGTLFCLGEYFARGVIFIVVIFLLKFMINNVTIYLNSYTSEVYHTKFRTTGIGMAQALGSLACIIVPLVLYPTYEASTFVPFLILAGMAAVATIAAFLLPYDTRGVQLDTIRNEVVGFAHTAV